MENFISKPLSVQLCEDVAVWIWCTIGIQDVFCEGLALNWGQGKRNQLYATNEERHQARWYFLDANTAAEIQAAAHNKRNSVPTSINRPVREDVFSTAQFQATFSWPSTSRGLWVTLQFEDHSKLRFSCSVRIHFPGMAEFWSAEVLDKGNSSRLYRPETRILANGTINFKNTSL